MSSPAPSSPRQAAQIFASLRKTFTPLSHLHAPLHVGYVDTETVKRLGDFPEEPCPIYLLQQGVWHASVEGLGDLGVLSDEEMPAFVDPFQATRNLLTSARSNIDSLLSFLDAIPSQPNAAHVLERCIREAEVRTVWMTRQKGMKIPSEPEIDELLDQVRGTRQPD